MAQFEFFGNPNCDRGRAASSALKHDAGGFFDCEGAIDIARRRGVSNSYDQLRLSGVPEPAPKRAKTSPYVPVPKSRMDPRPRPNEHWFFDLSNAAIIADYFFCRIAEQSSGLVLSVVCPPPFGPRGRRSNPQSVTAVDIGLWEAWAIIAACRLAARKTTYQVSSWRGLGRYENPRGLDQMKIANILAASGHRPYSVRARNASIPAGQPSNIFSTIIHSNSDGRPSQPGRGKGLTLWRPKFFRYLRLLEFVRLIEIRRGPKGGMAAARITWTDFAFLQTTAPPTTLSSEDDYVLACMAAGIPTG